MLQILIKRIACTDCRSLAKNIHAIGLLSYLSERVVSPLKLTIDEAWINQ